MYNIYIKIKFSLNLKRDKIAQSKKKTELNKNNEYRNQIEYKTSTHDTNMCHWPYGTTTATWHDVVYIFLN